MTSKLTYARDGTVTPPSARRTAPRRTKARFFASGQAFRAWLAANHESGAEIVVGFCKKTARRAGIAYQEALDQALAYGWIDGVRRRLDDDRWTIRFTRRKPRSIWSNVNINRVKELIELGRMQPPGVRAFEARDPKRSGVYLHEEQAATLDPASAKRLAANPRAKAFFDAQPAGYKRLAVRWVMAGKREETRIRRLVRIIEVSSRQQRIDFLKPNG